jgi:folate-binding protein YgfZ
LRIAGADRLSFLQGLVTKDVTPGGLSYAALLSPQGKYLADFFLLDVGDAVLLDAKAAQAPGLLQRLGMYRLRADVQIEPVEMPVYRGLGDAPEGAFADPRDPNLGWRFYGPLEAAPLDADWDGLRVAACVPEAAIELVANDSYILEMGFERLNGVDFKKGCYVGQEVTARMKHKTELKKGLVQVTVDGEAPVGAEIEAGGKAAGTLYTQSQGQGLAYLNFTRAKGALSAAGVAVQRTSGETEV